MATNFSLNEYLTIDTTGSIGIGTNVPLSRLHVTGSNSTTFPTAVLKAGTAVQRSGVGIFDVQNSAGTSLLFVSGSGKVGIGTASPGARLEIKAQINGTGYGLKVDTNTRTDGEGYVWFGDTATPDFYVDTTGLVGIGTASPVANFNVYSTSNGFVGMIAGSSFGAKFTSAAATGMRVDATDPTGTSTYSPMILGGTTLTLNANANSTSAPSLYIDTSQNVGIGSTTTLSARLQVSGSSTSSTPTMIVREGVASPTGGVGVLNVQNSTGTSLLFVSGSGFVGIGRTAWAYADPVYAYRLNVDGDIALYTSNDAAGVSTLRLGSSATIPQGIAQLVGTKTAASAGYMSFYTTTGGNPQERMRIFATGEVGIGTTVSNGNKLSVNGTTAITGSVLPGAASTYDLGSSGMKWRTVYATNLTGSLTQLADGTSYLIAGTNVSISTGSAGAVTINASLAGGAVTGTGTTNYYAKFTDTSTIGSGIVYDNGTNVGIGTSATNGNMLSVNGSTALSGSVLPGTTLTYDLGSSSKSWRELYARTGSFSGDVTISGNLTVAGTQTIINTQTVEIKDNAILLNVGPSPASTGGVYVVDTTAGVTGSLIWNATTDQWKAGRLGSEITLLSGSGTASYLAKWSGPNSLGGSNSLVASSVVYDDGTNVGIGTVTLDNRFNVYTTSANGTDGLHVFGGTTTSNVRIRPAMLDGSNNGIVQAGDSGIIFDAGAVDSGAFVIAPWASSTSGLRMTSTGSVGIGTASPGASFHVYSGATDEVARFESTSNPYISLYDTNVRQGYFYSNASSVELVAENSKPLYLQGETEIRFRTNTSTDRMIINSSGDVGIGTTSTDGARLKLYIPDSSGPTVGLLIHSGTLGTGVNSGVAYNASTLATFRYSNGGNTSLLTIKGIRHTAGSDWTSAATRIQQVTDSTNQAYIDFNPAGSAGEHGMAFGTLASERMRIATHGNVGIGGTNPLSRFEVIGSGATSATSTMNLLNSSNTSLLFVRDDGAVGIGTVTPALYGFNFKPLAYDSTYAYMGTMTPSGGAYVSGFIAFGDTAGTKYVRMAYAGSDTAANEVAIIDFTGTNRLAIGAALYVNSTTGNWNVGIGGTNPLSRFEVTGSGATSATSTMNLLNGSNTSLLFVRDDGNVGIGSSSPGYKLTVGGTVYATALSGSLTRLSDDTPYLIAGSNITLSTGSSGAVTINAALSGGAVSGTGAGTIGFLPKWDAPTNIANSIIYDDGTNIGIGTVTPGNRLSVYGSAQDQVYIRGTSTNRSGIRIDNSAGYQSQILLADGGSDKWQIGKQTDNTFFIYDPAAAANIFLGTYKSLNRSDVGLVPYQDGRAGIGTSPSTNGKLEIYATGSLQGIYQSDGTRWMRILAGTTTAGAFNNIVQENDSGIIFSGGTEDTGAFVIAPWANATSGLCITSVGNVGIGTNSSDYKLKVAGTVHATAFSGSLTKLTDGTSFLIAGPNITISTGSSGAVTIQAAAAPAAPSKASAYGTITGSLTMGRTSVGEYVWTQISSSAVNFLKTPTLTTSGGNVLVNSSFTFYSTDPFVQTSFTLARSADAGSTWTNLADSVAISNSSTTGRLLQTVAIGDIQTNIIPVNMMYFDTSLTAGSYIYAAYYKGVSGSADLGNGGEIYSILAYEV